MPTAALQLKPAATLDRTDGPRERLRNHAIGNLALTELIELVTGPGPDRSASIQRMLSHFGDTGHLALRAIAHAEPNTLEAVAGIGPAAAERLAAAFELGRRWVQSDAGPRPSFSSGRDVFQYMQPILRDLDHEEFHVLLLDNRRRLIRDLCTSSGTAKAAAIDASRTFRAAIAHNASSIILVHNHPGGSTEPSPEDCFVTRMLYKAGHWIQIDVLDHVIIGDNRYTSFTESGITFHDDTTENTAPATAWDHAPSQMPVR